VLHQRTLRGALFCHRLSGATCPAGGGHFTQPAPAAVITGNVAGPLSGRGRSSRWCRSIDSVAGIFARSATGASATCVDRRPSAAVVLFLGAGTEPATLAWPLDSLPAKTRRSLRHAIRSVSRRPHRLLAGWLLGTSCRAPIFCSRASGISCGLSFHLRCGSLLGRSRKSRRSCRLRRVESEFAKRRWWCLLAPLARVCRAGSGYGNCLGMHQSSWRLLADNGFFLLRRANSSPRRSEAHQ